MRAFLLSLTPRSVNTRLFRVKEDISTSLEKKAFGSIRLKTKCKNSIIMHKVHILRDSVQYF